MSENETPEPAAWQPADGGHYLIIAGQYRVKCQDLTQGMERLRTRIRKDKGRNSNGTGAVLMIVEGRADDHYRLHLTRPWGRKYQAIGEFWITNTRENMRVVKF